MKKITALILAVVLLTLAGCRQAPVEAAPSHTPGMTASPSPEVTGVPYICQVGVLLPSQNSPFQHWERAGQDMKNQLEAKGYTVELMYADNDVDIQNSQIEKLITKGCRVLVIAAVDGSALNPGLSEAKAAGVTVIAYDRMLHGTNTENMDYYVTFNIFRFGVAQGEFIENALGLKDGKGPFNIELFAGEGHDGNMMFYFEGGMSILRPYIENGQLVVKSGQTDCMDVCTEDWKTQNAKARMDDLLVKYYTKDKLDAVFALNDSIALGVIASLEDAGYTEFPIITGMDCDKPNVMAMKAGKQSMSVLWDWHILTAKTVAIIDAVMTGGDVPLPDAAEHMSNGIDYSMDPYGSRAFYCGPAVVTAATIQELLIDGGYYSEAGLEE